MKVSGFTFVRNAIDLGYPLVESITSVLPLCDEFVVAAGDSVDGTTQLLKSIASPKLRIIDTVWDPALFVDGKIFAQQTNVALQGCTGDWALYIQADEVAHEQDLSRIGARMRRHLDDPRVEGLVFDYIHFFGDFDHVQTSHNWYGREIRVVRTSIGISSWSDAQGFRLGGEKLRVAHSDATMYHYGHALPPDRLKRKGRAFAEAQVGVDAAAARSEHPEHRYGRLWGLRRFRGTHPGVMRERVKAQSWTAKPSSPVGHKHDWLGVQALTYLENYALGFRIGERRNYIMLPGMDSERRSRLPMDGRP
jgi:glycosyltransferase involved in cell wall biosynthesis